MKEAFLGALGYCRLHRRCAYWWPELAACVVRELAAHRFIGWPPAVRGRNLHLLACNTRFLILPWVQVRHLASHILARMARRLIADRKDTFVLKVGFETFDEFRPG